MARLAMDVDLPQLPPRLNEGHGLAPNKRFAALRSASERTTEVLLEVSRIQALRRRERHARLLCPMPTNQGLAKGTSETSGFGKNDGFI